MDQASSLTAILEDAWEFAKVMLGKAGEFYPFAETADGSGGRAMLGGFLGEEHPDPRSLYVFLKDSLARQVAEGKVCAVALAANVDVPKEYDSKYPDAIRVHIEAPGYARYVYLPYRVEPQTAAGRLFHRPNKTAYAEPFSVDIPPVFFPPGDLAKD